MWFYSHLLDYNFVIGNCSSVWGSDFSSRGSFIQFSLSLYLCACVCRQDHTQALNHCQGFLVGLISDYKARCRRLSKLFNKCSLEDNVPWVWAGCSNFQDFPKPAPLGVPGNIRCSFLSGYPYSAWRWPLFEWASSLMHITKYFNGKRKC